MKTNIKQTADYHKHIALEECLLESFEFKNDEIANKIFCRKKGSNENFKEAHLPTLLYYVRRNASYQTSRGVSACWCVKYLAEMIESKQFSKPVNPLKDYLNSLDPPSDKNKPFEQLADYIVLEEKSDSGFLVKALKKWFVGAVSSLFEEDFVQKQILVLRSTEENIGKTRFTNFLLPKNLRRFSKTEVDISNKDAEIALASNWVLMFDEIDQFLATKKNRSAFKSYISRQSINLRRPYSKNPFSMPRIASILATCNTTEFISKSTGTTRFVVFDVKEIKNIDWFNQKRLSGFELTPFVPFEKFDMGSVWSAALALYRDGFKAYYSREESRDLQERNGKYQFSCPVKDEIFDLFDPSEKANEAAIFLTANQILNELTGADPKLDINIIRLGRILSAGGFVKKAKKVTGKTIYGYYVVRRVDQHTNPSIHPEKDGWVEPKATKKRHEL